VFLFSKDGNLFPGIHLVTWQEIQDEFNFSERRKHLITGLYRALLEFRKAGCQKIYIDGSFVTKKNEPNDYDVCWDITGVNLAVLDTVLYDIKSGTALQKIKYYGEFYPANIVEGISGLTFLNFFQMDRSGKSKGILQLDLKGVM